MPKPKPPFEVRCINNKDCEGELTVGKTYTVTKVHGGEFDKIVLYQIDVLDDRQQANYYADRFEFVKDKFDVLVEEVQRALAAIESINVDNWRDKRWEARIILSDALKTVGVDVIREQAQETEQANGNKQE